MGHGIRRTLFARLRDMVFCFFISIYPFSQLYCICVFFASEKVEHGYYGVTPFRYTSTFISLDHRTPTSLLAAFLFLFGEGYEFWKYMSIDDGQRLNTHLIQTSIIERQCALQVG